PPSHNLYMLSLHDALPILDECGQRCHNINISGKLPIHTYEALNHWRQKDNWNGEYQNDEKFIAKICHHMRMVIMPAMIMITMIMGFVVFLMVMMMLPMLSMFVMRIAFLMFHFYPPRWLYLIVYKCNRFN